MGQRDKREVPIIGRSFRSAIDPLQFFVLGLSVSALRRERSVA